MTEYSGDSLGLLLIIKCCLSLGKADLNVLENIKSKLFDQYRRHGLKVNDLITMSVSLRKYLLDERVCNAIDNQHYKLSSVLFLCSSAFLSLSLGDGRENISSQSMPEDYAPQKRHRPYNDM